MRSELTDTVSSLPRRDYGDPKCASPFCDHVTRVRGEFCRDCQAQQERHRDAMRAFREKRQAAS